jgi:hypothetical protein
MDLLKRLIATFTIGALHGRFKQLTLIGLVLHA